jgi:transposase
VTYCENNFGLGRSLPHALVRLLARIVGVGVETADMLVHEVLSRPIRDRRAVAHYAGLTGAPDESGAQRREQGLARAATQGIQALNPDQLLKFLHEWLAELASSYGVGKSTISRLTA